MGTKIAEIAVRRGEKILVCTQSNDALDHFIKQFVNLFENAKEIEGKIARITSENYETSDAVKSTRPYWTNTMDS